MKLVISIALLIPTAVLAGCGSTLGVSRNPETFQQVDRLARPAVNEVFASVAGDRHKTNNEIAPGQDSSQLANDIQNFMVNTAGRSQATTDVVKAAETSTW